MNVTCPKCGESFNYKANKCPHCGKKNNKTLCPTCGAEMDKNAKACPKCGAQNRKHIIAYSVCAVIVVIMWFVCRSIWRDALREIFNFLRL